MASPSASCHPAVPSLIPWPPAVPAPQPWASPREASSRERVGATPGAQLCPLSPTPFLVSLVPWDKDGGWAVGCLVPTKPLVLHRASWIWCGGCVGQRGCVGVPGGPNVWPNTAELWWCQGMVVACFMGPGVWGPGAVLPVCDVPEGRAVCWGGSAGRGPGALQRVLRSPITSQSGSTVPLLLSPHCPPPLCGAASLVLALERCAGTLPLGCHCLGHCCTRG